MTGMDMMSGSMERFRQDPAFQSMLTAFTSPMLAFLVVNSVYRRYSVVGRHRSHCSGNDPCRRRNRLSITYQIAIPLVLGANIGTCMTALLSSIGTSRDAKRVVAMHIYTNAIGGIVCIILMYIAMAFSPNIFADPISMIGVAVVHTVFNLVNTVAFCTL